MKNKDEQKKQRTFDVQLVGIKHQISVKNTEQVFDVFTIGKKRTKQKTMGNFTQTTTKLKVQQRSFVLETESIFPFVAARVKIMTM